MEEMVDVSVAGLRMTSSKILAHEIHAGLEQVQSRPERLSDRRGRRTRGRHVHVANVRLSSMAGNQLGLPIAGRMVTHCAPVRPVRSAARQLPCEAKSAPYSRRHCFKRPIEARNGS